jgi:hypothetical protein
VSFSDRLLSVVNIYPVLFRLLLQNHWANINQIWQKSSGGSVEDLSMFKSRERPCSRGDNSKSKNTLKLFKNLFLQNQQANFNPTWYKSIKGQVAFKGEIITKIVRGHLKIVFSRTTWPDNLKFTWKLPDVVQIQICSSNHGLRGSGWATIGETVLLCVHIGKIF